MPTDDALAGDVPAVPAALAEGSRPLVAEDVIATYVADAVRAVPGVQHLHGNAWQELSNKVHMAKPKRGVAVREVGPGEIELDVHVSIAWGTVIPEMAAALQKTVAHKVETMLDLSVRTTKVFVDEVEAPSELA